MKFHSIFNPNNQKAQLNDKLLLQNDNIRPCNVNRVTQTTSKATAKIPQENNRKQFATHTVS